MYLCVLENVAVVVGVLLAVDGLRVWRFLQLVGRLRYLKIINGANRKAKYHEAERWFTVNFKLSVLPSTKSIL